MFAYCNSNPVAFKDASGAASQVCITADGVANDYPWRDIGGGGYTRRAVAAPKDYITDQDAQGVGDLRLGLATVSHGGCGAIAAYNALITLGNAEDFSDVLDYFQEKSCAFGYLGILPHTVANYFTSKGYTVIVTDDRDALDLYSTTADACILLYAWPETYGDCIDAFGAHFVHYRQKHNGYIAYNVGYYGTQTFSKPSSYAYSKDRYYAIGIFIYK